MESYLIIHNVTKSHNVGTLLRSASAFNVSEVFIVGSKKLQTFGNQGTAKRLVYRHFGKLHELRQFCLENDIDICGTEITSSSLNIWSQPFRKSTAFLLGNEGHGLTEQEKQICDYFVYIPQYQSNTQSLNVSVAGSIILFHFANWASFQESQIIGEKYEVIDETGEIAQKKHAEAIRQQRQARETADDIDFQNLFD